MKTITTTFRPSVHGFQFGNGFAHQVIFSGLSTWGRCNGIAHTACDYYFAGRTAPTIRVVDYGVKPRSGLAVTSWAPGRVDLFARGDSDVLVTRQLRDGQWTPWNAVLRGPIRETPAAASSGPERIDTLVRDDAQKIRHRRWHSRDGALPPRCTALPSGGLDTKGLSDASPSLTAPVPGRLESFAHGLDGSLWFTCCTEDTPGGFSWQAWSSLGRPEHVELVGAPAACSAYGWMNAVVRGSNGEMWHKEWIDNAWQPWRSAGGVLTSAPALASPAPGRLEAYVRGQDGELWFNLHEGRRWGGWTGLHVPPPGMSGDQPAALSALGSMEVYVRADDTTVWRRRFAGSWQPWESTEPVITDDSRHLSDAIYRRMMGSTHDKLIRAGAALTAAGVIGVLALPVLLPFAVEAGVAINYLVWKFHSDDSCFGWTVGDELARLVARLRAGGPVPLALIDPTGGWGHEVVAYEVLLGASAASGTHNPTHVPGPDTFVRIYDPAYPGCDNHWIRYDMAGKRVVTTAGEQYKGAFVRTDYVPVRPPL